MSNNLNTLYGKAKYCYLSEADTGFGKNDYHVTLELSREVAQEHIRSIEGIISKEVAEEHKKVPNQTSLLKRAPLPYKINGDLVTFKIHSKFKPKLWDKNQKELGPDVYVWKNSTMWISYDARGYNKSIGIGCTLYMSGVQIDKLVEGSSQNGDCPFPNRENKQEATI